MTASVMCASINNFLFHYRDITNNKTELSRLFPLYSNKITKFLHVNYQVKISMAKELPFS